MKITRSIVLNIIFHVGASIAPFGEPYQITESAWKAEQPGCLTSEDGGPWMSGSDFKWGDKFETIGPEGRPYFQIRSADVKDHIDIYNLSGAQRLYVLKRHNNNERPWALVSILSNAVHRVQDSSIQLFWHKK
jgi:hypothetical protein